MSIKYTHIGIITAKGGMWEKTSYLRETKRYWINSFIPPIKFSKETGKDVSPIGVNWELNIDSITEAMLPITVCK